MDVNVRLRGIKKLEYKNVVNVERTSKHVKVVFKGNYFIPIKELEIKDINIINLDKSLYVNLDSFKDLGLERNGESVNFPFLDMAFNEISKFINNNYEKDNIFRH